MKFGVLGWIVGDLSDVDAELVAGAAAIGLTGTGAHLTLPADEVDREVAQRAVDCVRDGGLDFFQLWGPYPRIIDPDEEVRRAGVAGAAAIARLAAEVGIPGSGIRPTSLNPDGDWWPHAENHSARSEDLLVRSISEVLEVAVPLGVKLVLETHQTSTLDSAERIKRVIDRTDPEWVLVNIDPANFVSSLPVAFNPAPMIDELFDVLGPHAATVHVKDVRFEDRFVIHIAETVPGTGIMDLDTVLTRTAALGPDMYAVVEHLPRTDVPAAAHHLMERSAALGLWSQD